MNTVNPRHLGHKALAVNLERLGRLWGQTAGVYAGAGLPRADEAWLGPFSEGLLALADEHGCELIGGDTTQGPLNICITVLGEVLRGEWPLAGAAALWCQRR